MQDRIDAIRCKQDAIQLIDLISDKIDKYSADLKTYNDKIVMYHGHHAWMRLLKPIMDKRDMTARIIAKYNAGKCQIKLDWDV